MKEEFLLTAKEILLGFVYGKYNTENLNIEQQAEWKVKLILSLIPKELWEKIEAVTGVCPECLGCCCPKNDYIACGQCEFMYKNEALQADCALMDSKDMPESCYMNQPCPNPNCKDGKVINLDRLGDTKKAMTEVVDYVLKYSDGATIFNYPHGKTQLSDWGLGENQYSQS